MQPSPTRADARTVIRLLALVVAAAALLSGCSSKEGARAQELLQQAELAQSKLDSATFEAKLSFAIDGKRVDAAMTGAASKEGAVFSVRTTGIPEAAGTDVEVVVRGKRAWMSQNAGPWTSMEIPNQMNGMSGSMGAEAFQELARYIHDVRVTEHEQIAGKPVTTITGKIDTTGMLEALAKLESLSGTGNGSFSFDLDELGVKLGDITAVLSIDETAHLLNSAFVTFVMEAQGQKLELQLQYRLTSWNRPVELPAVPGG
jgi:carbon monoxide dehydrogenase subunit G